MSDTTVPISHPQRCPKLRFLPNSSTQHPVLLLTNMKPEPSAVHSPNTVDSYNIKLGSQKAIFHNFEAEPSYVLQIVMNKFI